jgi:membrane associated rhomboid family serine protease
MRLASFVVVFFIVFVLGGLFLSPHLPPIPERPVTVFEVQYWRGNWAGAVLGLFLGWLSDRSARRKRRREKGVSEGTP